MLSAVLILAILFLIIYRWFIFYQQYASLRDLTETRYYFPFIGHILLMLKKNFFDAINTCSKSKIPCTIWEGPYPMYLTNDPNEIKIILNSPNSLEKSDKFRYFFKDVFGESIIIADGCCVFFDEGFINKSFNKTLNLADKWKQNRKILSKAFQQHILDSFVYVFQERSVILMDVLQNEISDLYYTFQKFSTDNFLITNTGLDMEVQIRDNVEFVKYLIRGQKHLTDRFFKPHFWIKFIFYTFGGGKKLYYYIKKTNTFMRKVLANRKQYKMQSNEYSEKSAKPIIDIMLDFNDRWTEEYIIDELKVFFYAATDTTAYSLAFVCTLLGMHSEIQLKVYDEVMNVVGVNNPIETRHLSDLKYTEMVINETLRLLPVIPFIARDVTAALNIGKLLLPEGTRVLMSIFHLHRNEKYYPDPLKFDPDRFLPENIAKRPPYTFLPFSGGPRNCIGKKYAMMLMKTAIANIVRKFNIYSSYSSVEDLKLESYIVMKSTHPLDCSFSLRLN